MFSSLTACNELVCDDCREDDISYTYGELPKPSSSETESTEEESKTQEESTLDNSTILSHTLHPDWETIATETMMNETIYRNLDEARSGLNGATSDWKTRNRNGDNGYREIPSSSYMSTTGYISPPPTKRATNPPSQTPVIEWHDRSYSSRGDMRKADVPNLETLSNSRRKTRRGIDHDLSPSNTRNCSKGYERGNVVRTRSQSLTTPRSASRRSNHSRTNRRSKSTPRKSARGRSASTRKRRNDLARTSREALDAKAISDTKQPLNRSPSSSREPIAGRANTPKGKSPRRSKSRPRKQKTEPINRRPGRLTQLSSHSRATASGESQNRSVTSRLRGRSPGEQLREDRQSPGLQLLNEESTELRNESANLLSDGLQDTNISGTPHIVSPSNESNKNKPNGESNSVKKRIFSWRKKKAMSAAQDRKGIYLDPVQTFDVSAPPASEDFPSKGDEATESDGLAFLAPNAEGQEIAIQDNEHCYEDPANVHSMLTIPSMEICVNGDTMQMGGTEEPSLAFVLTANEDGTLVTDDGPAYVISPAEN